MLVIGVLSTLGIDDGWDPKVGTESLFGSLFTGIGDIAAIPAKTPLPSLRCTCSTVSKH